MPPIPTVWWLRPVSSACRVGEQSAVVWKRLSFSPFAAKRSAVGVAQGPPKALEAPKPDVVEQDDEDVGRTRRRPQWLDRWERRLRVLRILVHRPVIGTIGDRQHFTLTT